MAPVLLALTIFFVAAPVSAEMTLPPGFTAERYVTGQGFDPNTDRGSPGLPAMATIALDAAGALYLAKTPFRFREDPGDALGPIYRIPAGGARITRDTESRYRYGPPLWNPDVAGINAQGEVFVSTYERERRIGAVYRLRNGRAVFFAGGTPPSGSPPLLMDPEAVAFDGSGNVYILDREQGIVVKLDPTGKVLAPRYLTALGRGRSLAFDMEGQLWIGSDGPAGGPFQDGSGHIWKADPNGVLTLVLRGPLPAGMSLGPGGGLFVALRLAGKILALSPDGRQIEFAGFADTILRALVFAPDTEETRRAGIAGNLFVVVSPRMNFVVSEVIRISGPFDDFTRREVRVPPSRSQR